MRQSSAILYQILIVALVAAATHAGYTQSAAPVPSHGAQFSAQDLSDLVERMEQAQLDNRARYRAYTITREYRLYANDNQKANSEVVANVSFVPPSTKSFTIEKVAGSDRGEKVVRRILDKESEMAEQDAPGAVSRRNYEFSYLGRTNLDGRPCYVLGLKPKRSEKDLVEGKAYVDAGTYLVRRVEGNMAKTPSWWLKKVYLTLDFTDVRGMWLQTGTNAVADVRLLGRHTLTSEAVRVRTSDEVAQVKPVPRRSFFHASPNPAARRTFVRPRTQTHPPLIGAGVFEP